MGDGGPQEAGLVDRQAGADPVGVGLGELGPDRVEAVGVHEAAPRDAPLVDAAQVDRARVAQADPQLAGLGQQRQVVEVQGAVDGVGGGVDEGVGAGLEHRGPRREVLVGHEAGVAVDGHVVVNDGRARLEARQRVGSDLLGRAGHVRIRGLLGDPVDGRFDDDWSPIHGGTLGGAVGARGEKCQSRLGGRAGSGQRVEKGGTFLYCPRARPGGGGIHGGPRRMWISVCGSGGHRSNSCLRYMPS